MQGDFFQNPQGCYLENNIAIIKGQIDKLEVWLFTEDECQAVDPKSSFPDWQHLGTNSSGDLCAV